MAKNLCPRAAQSHVASAAPQRYPKLQIFTLAELFQDRRPKLPPLVSPNRRASRVETRASHQTGSRGSLI